MAVIIGGLVLTAAMAASQAAESNKASSKNYVGSLTGNMATNEAIVDSNLQNTIRSGMRVGILNVQRGLAKKNAIQQGFDISAKGMQALSTNEANASASGTVGSSVDAVVGHIQQKIDRAQGTLDENYEVQQDNFNKQLNDLIAQGQDSLEFGRSADYSGPTQVSQTKAILAATASQAASYGVQYGTATMNLGLGGGSNPAPSRSLGGSGYILPSMSQSNYG